MPETKESKSVISTDIGKVIRTLRKRKSISGGELGKLVNLSQQQISRYERGLNNITLDYLIIILQELDSSIEEFLYLLSLECGRDEEKDIFLSYCHFYKMKSNSYFFC
ncbi:hypothetical protein AHYW_000217 [Providencia manganoxydans]|uniref:helix-turn-helix domain-containing protein n=1 Tax=Providencia TaxID=586 RepID=UPI001120578B|nr:helix-turn-helix transcriptional regulator [Providencia stuartii]